MGNTVVETGYSIYYQNGGLDFIGDIDFGDRKVILFVDGDLNINGISIGAVNFQANDNTGFWEIHDDSGFVSKTESESTALLFAASPDILQSLQRLTHPMADDEDLEFALETIQKAKGKTL
jgi:hypothetical protein